jgi:L-ascorbate metabolism protein UlaG (beta-lactamase superfamily)
MIIRRLGWAGLEIEAGGESIVVDLLQDMSSMEQFLGPARTELPPPARPGRALAALVTHLHADHADPDAIRAALAPGGAVLRPARDGGEFLEVAATASQEDGLGDLPARIVGEWERCEIGPFAVTAVPAVDGFGDPQVSWVVEADGRRILHCGDTTFHGFWWRIRMRCGPFDAAFLPVNGAVCAFPHRTPASPLVAVLDPEQAAVAAELLEAPIAVPIHYDAIHAPPVYAQVDDPARRFTAAAGKRARVLAIGEELAL